MLIIECDYHPGLQQSALVDTDRGELSESRLAHREQFYREVVPEEKSSGDRRRLGHISKQGDALLRFLLVEAAQVTARSHLAVAQ